MQQAFNFVLCLARQRRVAAHPMHIARMNRGDARANSLQARQQRNGAECRQRIAALVVLQMQGS